MQQEISQRSRYSFWDIEKATLAHFRIQRREFIGRSRARYYAFPRFCAVYIARQWTPLSTPQLGRLLRRDHTTILTAERRARELIQADKDFREDMAAVMERMAAEPATVRELIRRAVQPLPPADLIETWI